MQRMIGGDPSAQQVQGEPAPLVVEVGHRRQRRRSVGATEVFGLHQPRAWVHLANGAHRQAHGSTLVDQSASERRVVAPMRVPQPVQAAEPGGGQGLVDRRVVIDPGIALRDLPRILRQARCKRRMDETGVARAAAVMGQARDDPDVEGTEAAEAVVRPRPVGRARAIGSDPLPEHGIPDGANAQAGERRKVAGPGGMPAALHLVEVSIADAIDRALDAAPELQAVLAAAVETPRFVHGVEKARAQSRL